MIEFLLDCLRFYIGLLLLGATFIVLAFIYGRFFPFR